MSKYSIYSTTIAKFNYVMRDKGTYSLQNFMLIKGESSVINMLEQMKTGGLWIIPKEMQPPPSLYLKNIRFIL